MAKNLKMSDAAVNAEANALSTLANNGYLRIYDGVQATNADTALGAQVLLAELRLNATAFAAAVAGVLTANALTPDSAANASGTATWFRVLQSDGTSVLWDGNVGVTGSTSDLELNSVAISINAAVSVSALTHTIPKV